MRGKAEPLHQLARPCLGQRRIDAPQSGDELEIFERRQLVVNHGLVGNPGRDLLCRHWIGEHIDPEDRDRAGVGLEQPRQHPQRGGLTGTVGSEKRVELAHTHFEIQSVDRRPVEALGKRPYLNGTWRVRLAHRIFRKLSACACESSVQKFQARKSGAAPWLSCKKSRPAQGSSSTC